MRMVMSTMMMTTIRMVMMMMMMIMKAGCFFAAFEVNRMQMWSLHVPHSFLRTMKISTLINGNNGEVWQWWFAVLLHLSSKKDPDLHKWVGGSKSVAAFKKKFHSIFLHLKAFCISTFQSILYFFILRAFYISPFKSVLYFSSEFFWEILSFHISPFKSILYFSI